MLYPHEIIPIGCDHAGLKIKQYIINNLQSEGYQMNDFGVFIEIPSDYPDIAHKLAKSIQDNEHKIGILICGSGNGMAIVANKYLKIRAAVCWNEEISALARKHNNANVLILPGRFLSAESSLKITRTFLITGFEGGRHIPRIEKISHLL
ncbi:MAG: ribose 5-phosphate isomerase B [bacterium]